MAGARTAGISGVAVLAAGAGGLLLYSSIKNASVADTLRSLIKGQPVVGESAGSLAQAETAVQQLLPASAAATGGGESAASLAGGESPGATAAADAAKYLGVPYRWAGADPSGFDCSGLVTWVLHHDMGIQLPDNTHTVTGVFYVWTGARTVPRAQCQPGDLVCWPSHIGIATDAGNMIHAPHTGDVVRRAAIWNTPAPVIRRPLAYTGRQTLAPAGS